MIVYSYFVSFVVETIDDSRLKTFGNRVYQSEVAIADANSISNMATVIANDVMKDMSEEDKGKYQFVILNFQYLKSEEIEI